MKGYGTLDVITLSGYGRGGRKMTPAQRRFKSAAKRCHGDAYCMSAALSGGYRGYGRRKKRGRRKGMGLLPHSSVAGTECIDWKMVYSPVYKKKVKRCAEFAYDRYNEYSSYDHTTPKGKKVGKGGKKYKRGVWKTLYSKRKRSWPGGGTSGQTCKAFKAGPKSKGCPVKCVSFKKKPKGTSQSASAAKKKCLGKRR
jgi:hypothetical protein